MIGVGITTRNRPEVLNYVLSQFVKYRDKNQDIVVIDDCSTMSVAPICEKYGIDYIINEHRMGIAGAKNELVKEFAQHEGMVLFDDDCFPTQEGWYEHFLRAHKNHKQHHMIYAREYRRQPDENGNNIPVIVLEDRFEYADVWKGCLGVCIWLSQYAIQKIGGWDPKFKRYGIEHHELTGRCYRANLSPLGHYVSPLKISDYIWCFDTDGDHGDFKWIHRGCMTNEEKQEAIAENQKVAEEMIRNPIKSNYREI